MATLLLPEHFDHIIFDPTDFHLETPSIQHTTEVIQGWLWAGLNGGIIYGMARVGKSTLIDILPDNLRTRDGRKIPSLKCDVPPRDVTTITAVFRRMCLSAGLRAVARDGTEELKPRIFHYLLDLSRKSGVRQLILFVDEFQRLQPHQLNPFAELYDDLHKQRIRLFVLFVGNDPACWELINQVRGHDQYDRIYQRFLKKDCEMPGIRSRMEVEYLLEQYDSLRYPANGQTYTNYFLPKDVSKKWRLTSLGLDLWRIFREISNRKQLPSWGMEDFCISIKLLLTDYISQFGVSEIDDDILREFVAFPLPNNSLGGYSHGNSSR